MNPEPYYVHILRFGGQMNGIIGKTGSTPTGMSHRVNLSSTESSETGYGDRHMTFTLSVNTQFRKGHGSMTVFVLEILVSGYINI